VLNYALKLAVSAEIKLFKQRINLCIAQCHIFIIVDAEKRSVDEGLAIQRMFEYLLLVKLNEMHK